MKSWKFYWFALLSFSSALHAITEIDIRPSFYYFIEESFRNVYGEGAFNIQVEARSEVYSPVYLFATGEYLQTTGASPNFYSSSNLWLGGVSTGLDFKINLPYRLALFLGAGVKFFFVKMEDESPYVQNTTHGNPIGWVIKSSLEYTVIKGLFLSAFLDYSQAPKQRLYNDYPSPLYINELDPGGVCAGASVGYRF